MILCVRSGEHELVIKKSRFLAFSYCIDSRDEVKAIIDALKAEHVDARHVCYGFIADEKGDDFGYDDNGEPTGTAGKPIYSALESQSARKSLIAVVRYFGGIKLGAGGLTRAYRSAASELIEKVGLTQAERVCVYDVIATADAYKKAASVLRAMGLVADDIRYAADVTFTVTANADIDLISALSPFGAIVNKRCEKLQSI